MQANRLERQDRERHAEPEFCQEPGSLRRKSGLLLAHHCRQGGEVEGAVAAEADCPVDVLLSALPRLQDCRAGVGRRAALFPVVWRSHRHERPLEEDAAAAL